MDLKVSLMHPHEKSSQEEFGYPPYEGQYCPTEPAELTDANPTSSSFSYSQNWLWSTLDLRVAL